MCVCDPSAPLDCMGSLSIASLASRNNLVSGHRHTFINNTYRLCDDKDKERETESEKEGDKKGGTVTELGGPANP